MNTRPHATNLLTPTVFIEALATLLVERVASGEKVTATCAAPGFPSLWVLRRWCAERPDFAAALNVAQEVRAMVLVDEAQDIADDSSDDWITVVHKDGREEVVLNHEHVQRSKLRVDMRKWIAGRLHREAWGEAKQVDINAKVLTINLTDDELDRQLAQATDKLRLIDQVIENVT